MKNKPLLNESTVRKFMKLANLGRVGEGFIAENYNQEEESELAEDKNFGGTQGHKMKPLKAGKKSSAKVMKEADEEEADMVPGDDDAGAETPDMGGAPEIEPATEPTEMDAETLGKEIIDVLERAGLVDVVEDDDTEEPVEDNETVVDDETTMDDEITMDDGQYEEEGIYEAKKAKLAKVVAERVMARIQKESRIDRLAETITQRVMAEAKRRG